MPREKEESHAACITVLNMSFPPFSSPRETLKCHCRGFVLYLFMECNNMLKEITEMLELENSFSLFPEETVFVV
jgi:hypothetical protein